uniref:Epoxide hydrolase A n=1 Tax=Vitis vinifera TaxID=29760 RepID=F6I1A9_VITVI
MNQIIDFLNTPSELPPWIIEKELQFSASKFQQSGFTGALNYYRAMDMNWELLGAWQGVKITTPTKFIVGDEDVGFEAFGRGDYIKGKAFKGLVPNMEVVVIGGHHHIQIEKAERVTSEILSFFGEW